MSKDCVDSVGERARRATVIGIFMDARKQQQHKTALEQKEKDIAYLHDSQMLCTGLRERRCVCVCFCV